MQDGARTLPEVLSESLRHLTALPEAMLPGLVARYGTSDQDVVLVGLFDLLIHHRSGPHNLDLLATFLRTSDHLDAYRYLATILLTSGRKVLVEELLAAAKIEARPDQLLVLSEVLVLLPGSGVVQKVRQEVLERLNRPAMSEKGKHQPVIRGT
jgi:hypothetical protein